MVLSLAVAACGLSPIDHRIKLGEEPFVVFVGEGIDGHTDLFTTTTGGGSVFQLTFTPVVESQPKLAGGGLMVAFLRYRDTLPGTHRDVVVMNLVTGSERVIGLPADAGTPLALGWGSGDSSLYIRTDAGNWRTSIPPSSAAAELVPANDSMAAVKAINPWLGQSRFAEAIPCKDGVCVVGPKQDTSELSAIGRYPLRWGNDSVAWLEGNEIVVRPLGTGRVRRISLKDAPLHVREASMGG